MMGTIGSRSLRTLVLELAAAESAARRVENDGVELTFTLSDELFRAWLDLVARVAAGGAPRRLH